MKTVVLCDRADPPAGLPEQSRLIRVNQRAPERNLRLEGWQITHWLLRSLRPLAADLLDIASYVYHADGSVRRGTDKDIFGQAWSRDFLFYVPVRCPDTWSAEPVRCLLQGALEFLTGDRFEFIFTERTPIPEQLVFEAIGAELPPSPDADCVTLFSGGMDSFAGAVHLLQQGRHPILVSHKSRSVLAALQTRLARPLAERFQCEVPHLGVWANREGEPANENTQRSRSFLYLALGAAIAQELGLDRLVICENGVTTFNLPRLKQTVGTQATRSTHPRFLHEFSRLCSLIFGTGLQLETPFLWKTRVEVLEILRLSPCADLLPRSVSCARSRRTNLHPHCGVCSQCVDRRLAVVAAGMNSDDERDTYDTDIFRRPLRNGQDRALVLGTVRFAMELAECSADAFCQAYPEVFYAIDALPGNPDDVLRQIHDLHARFGSEVRSAVGSQFGDSWYDLPTLPDDSLLK